MIIIKRQIITLLVFTLIACLCVPVGAYSAQSHIAVRVDDFSAYSEGNGYAPMEIASVTKIMTAVVVLETCEDIYTPFPVHDEAIGVEGSSIYLKRGERLSVEELLWALMLNSANDAAVALAIRVGGSVDAFVELMNIKAKALCMSDTVYATPHGLPAEGQHSSAHDQALLACYALSVDGFTAICSTYSYSIPYDGTAGGRYLRNHNRLLKSFDGCIGMKTGYTKSAGRCLVTCARRDGITLVCVTLNAPDDWNDHRSLLDTGFDLFCKNDTE